MNHAHSRNLIGEDSVAGPRIHDVANARPEDENIIFLPRVTLIQSSARPHLDFILPGLPAGSVGMIVGQGAIGKSFLALHIGLALATGKPVAGGLWPPPKTGKVTVVMGEDGQDILQERLYWLRQQEQMDDDQANDADKLLRILSASGFDMRITEKTRDGYIHGPFFKVLHKLCTDQRLIIIDPLLFLNGGGEENNNGAAAVFMSHLYEIARETGCTIILLHHVGKSNGEREEWASARGASAFTTSVRWQVNMTPASKEDMTSAGLSEEMRKGWVQVACVKSNYGESPAPAWLKRAKGGVLKCSELIKIKVANNKSKKYCAEASKEGEYGKDW